MAVYITGDSHRMIDGQKLFDAKIHLNSDDILIVLGDFGFIWDGTKNEKRLLHQLNELPYTLAFIDGNHENHEMLADLPIQEWNGGKVSRLPCLDGNIIYLRRGQIYSIDGSSYFTMGGAMSHDKEHRIRGLSWWPQEIPSYADNLEAYNNIEKYGNDIDFILTHTCPESIGWAQITGKPDPTRKDLEAYYEALNFKHWFFGHFHEDIDIGDKFHCLYDSIVPISKYEVRV